MRREMLVAAALSAVATIAAAAQDTDKEKERSRVHTDCHDGAYSHSYSFSMPHRMSDRPVIGIATTSGSKRDTLGLLVTEVTTGGPADKAGLEEGDRLQSVNGVSLRIAAADAGDRETQGLMVRRLVRTIEKLKAGDAVDLSVYTDGRTRTVKITTVKASELEREDGMFGFNGLEDFDGAKVTMDGVRQQMRELRHVMPDMPRAMNFKVEVPEAPEAMDERFLVTPPVPPVPPAPPVPALRRGFTI